MTKIHQSIHKTSWVRPALVRTARPGNLGKIYSREKQYGMPCYVSLFVDSFG